MTETGIYATNIPVSEANFCPVTGNYCVLHAMPLPQTGRATQYEVQPCTGTGAWTTATFRVL